MSNPDARATRKGASDGSGEGTQAASREVGNPIINADSAHEEPAVDCAKSLDSRSKIAAGIATTKRVRRSVEHKYVESTHHGAAFWSSQRTDVPMYFGHQPEDTNCKRFTAQDHAMELLGKVTFEWLLPAVLGLFPFFVPLGHGARKCIIPDAVLLSELTPGDEAMLHANITYLNVTLSDRTFPCADIRKSSFLFYTCPGW